MGWIYLESKKRWIELKRDDKRLDRKWPHTPPGMVQFKERSNSKQFHYVHYAETKEEVALLVNRWRLYNIKKLEEQIEEIRKQLVIP